MHADRLAGIIAVVLGCGPFACSATSAVEADSTGTDAAATADHGGGGGSAQPDASTDANQDARAGSGGTAGSGGARRSDGAPPTPNPHAYAVFEQDFTAPGTSYANPWEDVTVAMTVTSPTGRATKIGGFYHSGTTYKARFRPDEAGTWKWTATVTDTQGGATPSSGTFQATAEGHGFIRQSNDNPNRWKYEDGIAYYGLGLQSFMPQVGGLDDPGGYNGGLYIAAGQAVNLDTFLSTTAASGMNMFRWTLDNWTPGLWETIDPSGNVYREAEALDGDRIAQSVRGYGFSILFTFFNAWSHRPPYFDSSTLAAGETKALQRYVQYLIDRYGAYIDIWEAVNEGNASAAWYAAIIPYLAENDPYRHDVTTSTVYALGATEYEAGVTVNMMHWYVPLTEDKAAKWTYANLKEWKAAGLAGANVPNTIVGETGNCCNVCNYGPTGFRLRNWAAFFAEAILVYWDDTASKDNCGGANTNYYIGDEERASAKVLMSFTRDFDPQAIMSNDVAVDDPTVTAYGLSGPVDYAAYFVAEDHSAPTTGATATVSPEAAGHATWINPTTGAVLGESDVPAGRQTLAIPTFTTDVALKIHAP